MVKKGDMVRILHTEYSADNLYVGALVKVQSVNPCGGAVKLRGYYNDGDGPASHADLTFYIEEVEVV